MKELIGIVFGVIKEVVIHISSIVFSLARSADGFLQRAEGDFFRIMHRLVSIEWIDRIDIIDLWYSTWIGLIDGEKYMVLRDLWIDEYIDRLNIMNKDHRVIDEMMVVGSG